MSGRVKYFEEIVAAWLYAEGFDFKREVPIRSPHGGYYRLDFYLEDYDVALEIDEAHHSAQREFDDWRDDYMAERGIHVLRIPASEIVDIQRGIEERWWSHYFVCYVEDELGFNDYLLNDELDEAV